nr:splicing factor 1 [Ipomoea batatas]
MRYEKQKERISYFLASGVYLKVEMSIKIEEASHNMQSTTMAPTTSAAKISIFANKSGFVIPKNKLSGSMVPVLRGGKKEGSESVNEESIKQVRRKTKWGPDLTQDTTVRKGRALAYQTRVDQIAQQLSSGPMDWEENQDTLTASSIPHYKLNAEKIKSLELEKREAIGEVLKLNPNYKPPAGYKPIQKEGKVPIPIKEHPGYNFIGLIFGPVSDTHKRLEKETGAKVKVYGIKADTGQKVEVTSADGNESCSSYQEMYVQVLADTYEKVDAAVSLIELLVNPVSVKAGSTSMTSSSNGMAATDNPGVVQPIAGSGLAPAHGHFQQYPWFPGSASQNTIATLPGSMSSTDPSAAVVGNPIQVSSLPNPSSAPSLFGPPGMVAGLGSVPQNPSLVSSRPNTPLVSQQPYMPLTPLGQIGAPRNPLITASESTAFHQNMVVPPQISVNQSMATGTSQVFRPPISNQSLPSAGGHTGWSGWNSPVAQGTNMMPMTPPIAAAQGSHPLVSNPMGISVAPPVGFPHGNPSGSAPAGIVNQQPTNSLLQSQMRHPLPQHPPSGHPNSTLPPQPVIPNSVTGRPSNFDAMNPLPIGAPRPQQSGSSDFIFQPHRPNSASQVIPRPVSRFDPPNIPLQNQLIQPGHAPQTPSIRPEMRNLNPSHAMPSFPELQVNNRMIQRQPIPVNFPGGPAGPPPPIRPMPFPNSGTPSFAHMHPRNFNPAAPPVNSGSYPPRTGNLMFHQNNPAMMTHPPNFPTSNNEFRPSKPAPGPFGVQQTYDPFSPTSLS